MTSQTPMMQQYFKVKKQYQDAILFFRLGDFYEMFFDDAIKASKLLDLTLTARNKNQADSVPLCGVPVHSAQGYINRLLASGHKVAICEQTEDPKQAKGIVKREVTQVLTPGLVLNPECLEGKSHNYVLAIQQHGQTWGIAFTDVSTGLFKLSQFSEVGNLMNEVLRLEPREILVSDEQKNYSWAQELAQTTLIRINSLPSLYFDPEYTNDLLERYYEMSILGLGLEEVPIAKQASGAILAYLDQSKFLEQKLLNAPQLYHSHTFMMLDENAKRNLELFETVQEKQKKGSLFWLLDQAATAMGSRQLRDWLLYPLIDKTQIEARLNAVNELVQNPEWLASLQQELKDFTDIERIQNRVVAGAANAKDMDALGCSLQKLPHLKEQCSVTKSKTIQTLYEQIDLLTDVQQKISSTLVDDPPFQLKEGGMIRTGVHPELDELRDIEKNGKSFISQMEATERAATGISSLKIRFNQVFGYYLEVTHTHKDKVPKHYVRKQTLTSAERYITDELKKYEDKVLGASEKIKELEYHLFCQLRDEVALAQQRIKQTASAIAHLDALVSLAQVARQHHWVKPTLVDEPKIEILKGRHPLVEALFHEEVFVPNDVQLNQDHCRLVMITGPNMAGKSTVMRQVGLICLLAQMGSFVPAAAATLGVIDRIFTRIGASDHLQKGLSTFMVEMLETAHILNHATAHSLVLLDEIGRGTSTFDGLSIAWAVAESLHDEAKALTLFATHYHELTDLAEEKTAIQNFHMAIQEYRGEIKFLRELRQGGTNRSYGVQVAAMAGLPKNTISRAKQILKLLERKDLEFSAQAKQNAIQPSLFEIVPSEVELELKKVDVNQLTPLEALNLLSRLKEKV